MELVETAPVGRFQLKLELILTQDHSAIEYSRLERCSSGVAQTSGRETPLVAGIWLKESWWRNSGGGTVLEGARSNGLSQLA